MTDNPDFAGLLCSRICHDLISPVGAIGNGVELLSAFGDVPAEETELIEQSARAARDALSFFRIAFGAADDGSAPVSLAELASVTRAHLGSPRREVVWRPMEGEISRSAGKLLLLLTLCSARAAPARGQIVIETAVDDPLDLSVAAEDSRAALDPSEAALLSGARASVSARNAHAALAAELARSLGATTAAAQCGERVRFTARRASTG